MTEYSTDVLVLEKEAVNEFNNVVTVFGRETGLFRARVTSARKIVSKLAGHLEPLSFTKMRIVKGRGTHVTDALKFDSLPKTSESLITVNLLKNLLPTEVPDGLLWYNLLAYREEPRALSPKKILGFLGFGAEESSCLLCNKRNPSYFSYKEATFFCHFCAKPSEVDQALILV